MQTNELTNDQQQRQDFVDNACYDLLVYLAKDKMVEWDIEYIGELRDTVQSILVDKLKLMTEMEFYPYIELKNEAQK